MSDEARRWNSVKELIDSYFISAQVFVKEQEKSYEKLKKLKNSNNEDKILEVTKCMIVRNTLVLVIGMLYIDNGRRFSENDPRYSKSKDLKTEYTGISIDDFGSDLNLRYRLSEISHPNHEVEFEIYQNKLTAAYESVKRSIPLNISGSRGDAHNDIRSSFALFGDEPIITKLSSVKSPTRCFVKDGHSFPKWNAAQWSHFFTTPTFDPNNESIQFLSRKKSMEKNMALKNIYEASYFKGLKKKLEELGREENQLKEKSTKSKDSTKRTKETSKNETTKRLKKHRKKGGSRDGEDEDELSEGDLFPPENLFQGKDGLMLQSALLEDEDDSDDGTNDAKPPNKANNTSLGLGRRDMEDEARLANAIQRSLMGDNDINNNNDAHCAIEAGQAIFSTNKSGANKSGANKSGALSNGSASLTNKPGDLSGEKEASSSGEPAATCGR